MDINEIKNCTVFETIGGSNAYGTNTPTSDLDLRGVCIPSNPSFYIGTGVNKFEQKDKEWPPDEDKVTYDFRKALRLITEGNPNMVDLLFTEDRFWKVCEAPWQDVIDSRELFLSKKMRFTYGGYAYSQLKRIQRHRGYLMNPPSHKPTREQFGLPEKKLVSKEKMGAFQWLLGKVLFDSIELMRVSPETRKELYGINYVGAVQSKIPQECKQEVKEITGVSDELIEAIFREKRYENAMDGWKSYQEWKTRRNAKRAEIEAKWGYDTKHAMHLVRLMRMGMEVLEAGEVHVFRPDAEELLSIRNGAWNYEKVVEFAEESDKKLEKLYKTSTLPKEPDRVAIDELCQRVISNYVFGGDTVRIEAND